MTSTRFPIFFMLLISGLVFSSCEKEVNMDLDSAPARLVVEGQIETNGYPVVILTHSIGFFSSIDLDILENSFVHDARVSVTDGIDTIELKEYALDTGLNGAQRFFVYTIDTTKPEQLEFRGQVERYYTLLITHQGKNYSSVTKIPRVRPVDAMWFERPENEGKVETARRLIIRFTDPDTLGNYIRYFTQRNSEIFLPGANSVYNDDIINGTVMDSLWIPAGYNRNKDPDFDSLGVFFVGDTVRLRWCAIDRHVYDFFRTFEYATGTVGNPFSAPINAQTNISGGALGVWAGYGASYSTEIVPH